MRIERVVVGIDVDLDPAERWQNVHQRPLMRDRFGKEKGPSNMKPENDAFEGS